MSDRAHRTGVIVVGVDGSPAALSAAFWAAQDAARRHLRLRLVHALAAPLTLHPGLVADPESLPDDRRLRARGLLDDAAETARAAAPGRDVETVGRIAHPVSLLREESRHADTVVVGVSGRGGRAGQFLGSTATALASTAHCPLAVVRAGAETAAPPETGNVVVGIDGSPASEAAVGYAFEQASFRECDLVAVHAWNDVTVTAAPVVYDVAAIEERADRVLAERLAGWPEKYPDVPVRRVTSADRPVHALLDAAVDAQLLVVGSRGRGGLGSLVLGSTSRSLLCQAPVPVVVVRDEV